MRLTSRGEIPRLDLAAAYRLVPAIRAEWHGLRFDRNGRLQDPDTGDTSTSFVLTAGSHRSPGARYALTPPGGTPVAVALTSDDGRTVRATLSAKGWSVDVGLGEQSTAAGRFDVRTLLRANDVPGSVISLVGGREATAELEIDPSALGRRGDLVTGRGRAQRARADGVLHVTTTSTRWRGSITLHVHGRGVLGRSALVGARSLVRRTLRTSLEEFWSDAATEVESLRADLARLDGLIDEAGGPQALVHRELWRALREEQPAAPPADGSGSSGAAPGTASPRSAKRGFSRRYERRVEIVPSPGPDLDPDGLILGRRGDTITARKPTTSQYRTPPHFAGRYGTRAGRPALVGTVRESWGNTVFSRGYLFVTVLMAAVLVAGAVAWLGNGTSGGRAPTIIGLIGVVLFSALWRWFATDRRPDFERDADDLERSLQHYLAAGGGWSSGSVPPR